MAASEYGDRGAVWQNHNSGLSTSMFFSAALHPTDRQFILGGLRDFAQSVRTTTTRWAILPQVSSFEAGEAEVAMSTRNPTTHWMVAWIQGAVQRTLDGGVTLTRADSGIGKVGAAFVAPVRHCPFDDDVFVTGTHRLWRTNNFFTATSPEWIANGPFHPYPFPFVPEAPSTILSIAFAPSESNCNTYAYGKSWRRGVSHARRRDHVDQS